MSGSIHDAMTMMFTHGKNSMSDAELQELGMLTDQAVDQARSLAQICEGLGMLIASDSAGGVGAGRLEGADDVPTLLFSLSHAFDTIAGMVCVGEMADGVRSRRVKS